MDCYAEQILATDVFTVGYSVPHDKQDKPCIDELSCFTDACREALAECWCTSLEGLTCVVCDDNVSGIDLTPPPDKPPQDDDDPDKPSFVATPFRFTASSSESPIPIVYGRVVVPGNIIWMSRGRTNTYTKNVLSGASRRIVEEDVRVVDLLVGLCEGDIQAVTRVWLNDALIIDNTTLTGETYNRRVLPEDFSLQLFSGSVAQGGRVLSAPSFSRVVAYRGLSYAEIKNFPVSASGTKVPVLRFEVVSKQSQGSSTFTVTPGSYNSNFSVDGPSGRILASTASTIEVIGAASFTTEKTFSETVAASGSYTADGHIIYQTSSNDLCFRDGANSGSKYAVATTAGLSHIGAVEALDGTTPIVSVVGIRGSDVALYKLNKNTGAFSAVTTHNGATLSPPINTPFIYGTTGRFYQDGATGADFGAVFITQRAEGEVCFVNYLVYSDSQNYDYSETRVPEIISALPFAYGVSAAAVLNNAVFLPWHQCFILFFSDAATKYAVRVEIDSPGAATWTTEIDAVPTGELLVSGGGAGYAFIANGSIFSLNPADGQTTSVYTLSDNGAPAFSGGTQCYDSSRVAVTYVSSGDFVRVFPFKRVYTEPSLTEVFADLFDKAGLERRDYELSGLNPVTVSGFAVIEQKTLGEVIEQLIEFYGLSLVESSVRLAVRHFNNSPQIVVDENLYAKTYKYTRAATLNSDYYYCRIGYFDVDRDNALFFQSVSRDMIQDEGDNVEFSQGIEYSLNLYATKDVVRRAAELGLLRRLYNRDAYNVIIGPRYLSAEAGDTITFSSSSRAFRLESTELDTTFEAAFNGVTDNSDVYSEMPALAGYTPDAAFSALDYSSELRNYAVAFNVPLVTDSGIGYETVYCGQVRGDGATFSPEVQRVVTPGGVSQLVSVTDEALVGTLVTPPSDTLSPFTTQRSGQLVIRFDRDASGLLFSRPVDELYASTSTNLLFVGSELIQFADVSLDVDNRTATFTTLLRGRFGTEIYTGAHVSGESCALFSSTALASPVLATNAGELAEYADIYLQSPSAASIIRNRRVALTEDSFIWSGFNVTCRKQPATGSTGVYLRYYGRAPYENGLRIDESGILRYVESWWRNRSVNFFILNAPYDPDAFASNILLGGWKSPSSTIASTNPYIVRRLDGKMLSFSSAPEYGRYYANNLFVTSDGFTYNSDIHLAICVGIPILHRDTSAELGFEVEGRPTGYTFEGQVDYTKFKQGIRVHG